MKKVLIALATSLLVVTCVSGCSLFTEGDPTPKPTGEPIVISDDITHEDPTDIEFTTRYAYHTTSENKIVVDAYREQFNVGLVDKADILYGDKDDVAVRAYAYFVFESEEDAKKYCEELVTYARDAKVVGKTVYYIEEQEALKDEIESWYAMNVLDGTTASAYAVFLQGLDNLIEY